VVRTVASTEVASLAGMVKAPGRGVARSLDDFDPASLLTKPRRDQA
jgi:hypothetical protein